MRPLLRNLLILLGCAAIATLAVTVDTVLLFVGVPDRADYLQREAHLVQPATTPVVRHD